MTYDRYLLVLVIDINIIINIINIAYCWGAALPNQTTTGLGMGLQCAGSQWELWIQIPAGRDSTCCHTNTSCRSHQGYSTYNYNTNRSCGTVRAVTVACVRYRTIILQYVQYVYRSHGMYSIYCTVCTICTLCTVRTVRTKCTEFTYVLQNLPNTLIILTHLVSV